MELLTDELRRELPTLHAKKLGLLLHHLYNTL
jgi:hypothetical protein